MSRLLPIDDVVARDCLSSAAVLSTPILEEHEVQHGYAITQRWDDLKLSAEPGNLFSQTNTILTPASFFTSPTSPTPPS